MALLDELADICAVREAGEADGVDGVAARVVARPASTSETSALMRACHERGVAVVVRGTGSKLTWGTPPTRLDVVLETGAMDALVEHAHGDLIATAQAGMPVRTLAAALAGRHQQLLVDDPVGASTLGGMLAANVSGPRRMLPGAIRDLLIGVTMVRADGTVAKSGGKVVKNVAGYDLGKLLVGSYGTLGVITEATFRLHPVPPATRWVEAPVPAERLTDTLGALVHSQLVPGALEVDRPAGDDTTTVAVMVTGTEGGVESRAAALYEMLPGAHLGDDLSWASRYPWQHRGSDGGHLALKLTTRLSGVPTLLAQAADAGVHVRGSAGVGVLYGSLPAADSAPETVARLRETCTTLGGSLVVLDAPRASKESLDVWGPVHGLDLMRRVKHEFDPTGVLAPGRFVGGI
jgi:glycolate oxidase FAD binding subunit